MMGYELTEQLDTEELEAWQVILRLSTRLLHQLDEDLMHDSGIDLATYGVLNTLSVAPDRRLRMSELAAQVVSSPSKLTHQMKRIEKLGLVRREPCKHDGRVTWAKLTAYGAVILKQHTPKHMERVTEHLLDHLSPEAKHVINTELLRVVEKLEVNQLH